MFELGEGICTTAVGQDHGLRREQRPEQPDHLLVNGPLELDDSGQGVVDVNPFTAGELRVMPLRKFDDGIVGEAEQVPLLHLPPSGLLAAMLLRKLIGQPAGMLGDHRETRRVDAGLLCDLAANSVIRLLAPLDPALGELPPGGAVGPSEDEDATGVVGDDRPDIRPKRRAHVRPRFCVFSRLVVLDRTLRDACSRLEDNREHCSTRTFYEKSICLAWAQTYYWAVRAFGT